MYVSAKEHRSLGRIIQQFRTSPVSFLQSANRDIPKYRLFFYLFFYASSVVVLPRLYWSTVLILSKLSHFYVSCNTKGFESLDVALLWLKMHLIVNFPPVPMSMLQIFSGTQLMYYRCLFLHFSLKWDSPRG